MGARGQPRGRPGTGDADLREMLGVLALDNLLDVAAVDAPGGGASSCPQRASGPARRATAPRPTGSATRSAAHGWEVRDGPDGPELLPAA